MKVIMLDIDGCLNSERFYCNRIQWKYRKFFDILKALKIFNIWKYINRTDTVPSITLKILTPKIPPNSYKLEATNG